LLLFYGAGGIFIYSGLVIFAGNDLTKALWVGLGARIFMMALTVGIAFIAVNLLRRKEDIERRQLSRVKFLTYVSQTLNSVDTQQDLSEFLQEFVKILNIELKDSLQSWSRVFIQDADSPHMNAISDPENSKPELKQVLGSHTCPAFQNKKIFTLNDAAQEEPCAVEGFDFKSHLCVPIMGAQNDSYGVLFSGSPRVQAFGIEDVSFFQFLAKSVGLTIQRIRRLQELRQTYEIDSFAMVCFMESFRNPPATHDAILDGFQMILKLNQMNLLLWDKHKGHLQSIRHREWKKNIVDMPPFQMGEGIPGRALESNEPYWTYDLNDVDGKEYVAGSYKSLIAIPLKTVKGEPLGVMVATSITQGRLLTVEEIDRALTFSTRAAVAIENALLHAHEKEQLYLYLTTPDEQAA
jgi:GAF domain-containing protein